MFQALWWKPEHRDPKVFWGALEAFFEWVESARAQGKSPAFCARACIRPTGVKHCSWISALEEQASHRASLRASLLLYPPPPPPPYT